MNFLAQHPLFKTLPPSALRRLSHAVRETSYAKGHSIYNELDGPHALWIVREGRVRLLRYSSSGRAFALGIVTKGGVFCFPSLMNGCPYPCRAVADTTTHLLKVPASMVHDLLRRYAAFACEALKRVCTECCQAHALCSASQERVEQRVLTLLVHLAESFGSTIPLSRQQVGELAGVARETANRILLKLEQAGVIRLAFGRLTIRDLAHLRSHVA